MRAVDTNVLARFLLVDDDRQTAIATGILRDQVWVAFTVWLELGWVLAERAHLDRQMAADALDSLLNFDTVHTEDRDGMRWAVARFRKGADWADMVHLVATGSVADTFVTFDRHVSRRVGDNGPIPIETLA